MPTAPNILFITTDQQRADQAGCYGNPVIQTPHLDRLASQGVRCDRAYVANPLCMPSRSTMLTGLYPSQHGVWVNGIPLREEIPTLPEELARLGYRTAALGKLHITPYDAPGYRESVADWEQHGFQDWTGPFYGFQEVALTMHHNAPKGHYGEWIRTHHPEVEELFWQIEGRRPPSNPPMTWASEVPVEAHTSTWVGQITVDYLRRQAAAGQPFFAWVGFPDPHHPFSPPREIAGMYDPAAVPLPPRRTGDLADKPPQYRAWYEEGVRHEGAGGKFVPAQLTEQQLREMTAYNYAQVSLVDRNIGIILDELDRLGLAENTIVVFTADHGELLGEHGLLLKGPFLFEGLMRVPLIVRWPAGMAGGRATAAFVSLADLMPTLLEAAGAPVPGAMQGRSFLPVLRGESDQHRDAVLTEFHSAYFPGLNMRTLRTEHYKLTYYAGKPYGELYDLRQDPWEYENRWDDPAYGAVRADLTRRLLDEVLALDTGFPGPLSHA